MVRLLSVRKAAFWSRIGCEQAYDWFDAIDGNTKTYSTRGVPDAEAVAAVPGTGSRARRRRGIALCARAALF